MADRRGSKVRRARRIFLAAAFSVPAITAAQGQGGALEQAIKATYLVKFSSFITWPDKTFSSPTSPLVICIAGADPYGAALDQAASGQAVGQHPVEIHRIAAGAPPAGCQILFAGEAALTTLDAAARSPVLTITDQPASSSRKGIINFVVQDNHVRFEIDNRAAVDEGLQVSSQLLTLAVGDRARQ